MPRYFFDIYRDSTLTADDIGIELADSHAACQQAIVLLPPPDREDLPIGEMQSRRVVVRCRDGERCYQASLIYAGMWLQPADALGLYWAASDIDVEAP